MGVLSSLPSSSKPAKARKPSAPKFYLFCVDCQTTDASRLYRSGKMPRCHDCQHYANLVQKKTGGGVGFTREEFCAWRAQPGHRTCHYCQMDSAQLLALGMVNVRTGRVYEVIGVDRRDNAQPYRLENLVPCCGLCNAIKGNVLREEEMVDLGPVLSGIWAKRLREAKGLEAEV